MPDLGGVAERILRLATAADIGARSHRSPTDRVPARGASGEWGAYGSPRLQHDLQRHGFHIGRNRVIRLMRQEALSGRPRRRFRRTTERDPAVAPAPNLLAQRFTVAKPNTVWAADITALRRRAPRQHHSDRGTQYTSAAYQRELARHGVRCSMSGRGNCYDNAVVESFFHTLKTDLDHVVWATRRDAMVAVGHYITDCYNARRLHSTLGFRSPIEFERQRRVAA